MQQLPFTAMLPQSPWVPPRVSDLPVWDSCKRIGLDCETKDPNLKKLGIGVRRGDGHLAGFSFAFENGPGFYLPFGHEGKGNLDKEQCINYLRDQAKTYKGEIAGSNLPYDLDWLAEDGVDFKQVSKFRDIGVTGPLLNEHRFQYGLDAQAKLYDLPMKDTTLMKQAADIFQIDVKSEMWKLPPEFVGGYAEWDAHLPLKILRKAERDIESKGLWPMYDLESDVLPILVKMRRRGLAVDVDRLDQVTAHLEKMMQQMVDDINKRAPIRVSVTDLMATAKLAPLIRWLGYELPMTEPSKKFPQGQESITGDFLDSIDHPIAKSLKSARGFCTMKTTFCNSLYKYMVKGRIHSTFNQLKKDKKTGEAGKTSGTVSGRLSSEDPNAQNQPIRHETLGYIWRAIYRPDEGKIWVSSDIKAQEPMLTIHYAELCNLDGAKAAGDRVRNNPMEDAYAHMIQMTKLDRKVVKAIVLGVGYGMGEEKFCDSLGLPAVRRKIKGRWRMVAGMEASRILNNFNNAVPYIKGLSYKTSEQAKASGEIITFLGRICHFPVDPLGNPMFTHKAMNRLIQGSAADQMKKAMVLADRAGIPIQLQVHDELDFSASSEAEANHLASIMKGAITLSVPTRIDLETGPSWGEIDEKGRAQCKEFYAA